MNTSYLEIHVFYILLFSIACFIYIMVVTRGYRDSLKKIIKAKEQRVRNLAIEFIKENCDYVSINQNQLTQNQINKKLKENIDLIKKYEISKKELRKILGK